jgi:hypothetical protein
MYFNLVLLFPMYRSRGEPEYSELMMTQGTRAVWLLYGLVALTLISGVALAWLSAQHSDASVVWQRLLSGPGRVKLALWGLMLITHLAGTLRIWPKVFFALPSELDGLFFRYRCWMAVSAAAGTAAVTVSVFAQTGGF